MGFSVALHQMRHCSSLLPLPNGEPDELVCMDLHQPQQPLQPLQQQHPLQPQQPLQPLELLDDMLLQLQLLSQLCPGSLAALACTSTKFRLMIVDDSLWEKLWVELHSSMSWHEACHNPREQFYRDWLLRTRGPEPAVACAVHLNTEACYCVTPFEAGAGAGAQLLVGCAVRL